MTSSVATAARNLDRVPSVIYDFGMNNGDDVGYYLTKGARVIGVEANPVLCDQVRERFPKEIASGQLVVIPVALSEDDSGAPLTFYVHKTRHALSQLPKPVNIDDFREILVRCRTPASIVREYGPPLYIKIDVEHFDAEVLRNLFSAGIFPPEISAEAHTAEIFGLLASNGYRSFSLVDGKSVPDRYPGFPPDSAGPFGSDIGTEWYDADSFLHILSSAGLGWKDIHASRTIDPRASLKSREIAILHLKSAVRRIAATIRWALTG